MCTLEAHLSLFGHEVLFTRIDTEIWPKFSPLRSGVVRIVTGTLKGRMGVEPILPVKVPVTIDTMLKLLTGQNSVLVLVNKPSQNVICVGMKPNSTIFIWCNHIFTARIRRMREGTVFSLFVSPHLRGVPCAKSGQGGSPSQVWTGGVPHPRSGQGVHPIPGLDGAVPHPRSGWGIPHPWSGPGGTPFQVWMGGTRGTPPPARSEWGTPP